MQQLSAFHVEVELVSCLHIEAGALQQTAENNFTVSFKVVIVIFRRLFSNYASV